ncbi:PREDICTED: uncharacterized protein LOC104789810 [Camelina sativa]|uniref:Uncharacterized protein LOC104789810 n=1 Tax=Camelina sativa TaxID=90675 RepID=A0ABM0ZCD8_CAMSA|nr:PREDICTED: uncharacterized protein LOC104789810 [Camelina sativa]
MVNQSERRTLPPQATSSIRPSNQNSLIHETPAIQFGFQFAPSSSTGPCLEIEEIQSQICGMSSLLHRAFSTAPEIDRIVEVTRRTPFTQWILQAAIPNVKLKLPTYLGDKDPVLFMTSFMATVAKARFTDEQWDIVYCQLFVDSLSGPALTWFTRLESNSIDNFTELSTAFLKHYRIFIERGMSSLDLWVMAQDPGEPINMFSGRFKEKLANVFVPEDAAIAAFKKSLLPGSPLRKDLNIREPKDLDDTLHRASRFALVEEEDARLAEKTVSACSAPAKDKNWDEYHKPRKHHDPQDRKKGVVLAVSDVDGQSKSAPDPKDLYCDFLMVPDHSMHKCQHLKNSLYKKYISGEVEALYQPKVFHGGRGRHGGWPGGRSNGGHGAGGGGRGYANNGPANNIPQPANQVLVGHQEEMPQENELPGPPKRQRGQNPEHTNSPLQGRITMILGPLEECNDSVRALKKRARQVCSFQMVSDEHPFYTDPITFTLEDAKGIQHPHSDPLVVEVATGEFDFERSWLIPGAL